MGSSYPAKLPNLQVFYSEFAPYEFKGKDGNPTGFSMEIFQAISKQAGVPLTIKFTPWKRGLLELEEHPNSVIFTATRNEDREDKYIIIKKRVYIFVFDCNL